jgi:hypothetical protein
MYEEFRFHKKWPCTSRVSWDPSASVEQVPNNPNYANAMKAEGNYCSSDGQLLSLRRHGVQMDPALVYLFLKET